MEDNYIHIPIGQVFTVVKFERLTENVQVCVKAMLVVHHQEIFYISYKSITGGT